MPQTTQVKCAAPQVPVARPHGSRKCVDDGGARRGAASSDRNFEEQGGFCKNRYVNEDAGDRRTTFLHLGRGLGRRLLREERRVDVREHTAGGDGDRTQELVELFVVADS